MDLNQVLSNDCLQHWGGMSELAVCQCSKSLKIVLGLVENSMHGRGVLKPVRLQEAFVCHWAAFRLSFESDVTQAKHNGEWIDLSSQGAATLLQRFGER